MRGVISAELGCLLPTEMIDEILFDLYFSEMLSSFESGQAQHSAAWDNTACSFSS